MKNFITKKEAIIILQGHIIKNHLHSSEQKMSTDECNSIIEWLNSSVEDGDDPKKCNADDPNDPHYGDYGAYLSDCTWIWF